MKLLSTFYALRVRDRLAKQLLVVESSDDGRSTTWEKLSESYRDMLRRKAWRLMEVLDV